MPLPNFILGVEGL